MLKRGVLQERTYELLKTIMQDENFNDFVLFGGTALALQLGHRKSIDLDFVTENKTSLDKIKKIAKEKLGFVELRRTEDVIIGEIDNIKVDFVYEKSNIIAPIVEEEGIRILNIKDISAMKLMAICDNGSRLKDYVDIATLSYYFAFNDMLTFFNDKYDIKSTIVPVRPLCDFSRIDNSQKIDMINNDFDLDRCKKRIIDMVGNPDVILN